MKELANKRASATINQLLEYAELGSADEILFLGRGVHNDGYYARVGGREYCVRIARYEGKRGLIREADALARLPEGIAPRLVHFSEQTTPIDRLWSVTTFIDGVQPKALNVPQLASLGQKLAMVHRVPAPHDDVVDAGEVTGDKTDLWRYLLWSCRSFYADSEVITHERLAKLVPEIRRRLEAHPASARIPVEKRLLHKDVGVGNIVVRGDEVFLIDWEDREFGDPMSDFATGFWDIAAAGRTVLDPEGLQALYDGYRAVGGDIDEPRIASWMTFDKLVVALFLYNRISHPKPDAQAGQLAEYAHDLDAIISSLA